MCSVLIIESTFKSLLHIQNKRVKPIKYIICEMIVSLLRQDLESFSSLVKRMAGRLQVFGRELAETELPNNLLTASNLLKAQTSRKDSFKVFIKNNSESIQYVPPHTFILVLTKLFFISLLSQEEMTGALSQGRKLLENIREPVRRDPDSSLNPDQLENLATVHR